MGGSNHDSGIEAHVSGDESQCRCWQNSERRDINTSGTKAGNNRIADSLSTCPRISGNAYRRILGEEGSYRLSDFKAAVFCQVLPDDTPNAAATKQAPVSFW